MRSLVIAVLAVLLTTATAGATPIKSSLYNRLGGLPALTAVVDDFVGNVAKDRRINRFFVNANIPRLKKLLVEQLCAGTGGPCTYTGQDMKSAHRGMKISNFHFNAMAEDLVKSLRKFKVPARERRELLALFGSMRGDIVRRG